MRLSMRLSRNLFCRSRNQTRSSSSTCAQRNSNRTALGPGPWRHGMPGLRLKCSYAYLKAFQGALLGKQVQVMQKSACSVECTNVTIQLRQHRIQNIQHTHRTFTQDVFKASKQLVLNIEGISRCADTAIKLSQVKVLYGNKVDIRAASLLSMPKKEE